MMAVLTFIAIIIIINEIHNIKTAQAGHKILITKATPLNFPYTSLL